MAANTESETERILIVDDDRVLPRVLARAFERHGRAADVAPSGHEALARLAFGSYAAAVIDLELGDMTGLEILEALPVVSPGTAALVLTGYPSPSVRDLALRLGAASYIARPFRTEQLLDAVDDGLQLRRERGALPRRTECKNGRDPSRCDHRCEDCPEGTAALAM